MVTKDTNLDRICICDGWANVMVSDLQTIGENNTRGENRCSSKRRVIKSLTESAVNAVFLDEIKERDE